MPDAIPAADNTPKSVLLSGPEKDADNKQGHIDTAGCVGRK